MKKSTKRRIIRIIAVLFATLLIAECVMLIGGNLFTG